MFQIRTRRTSFKRQNHEADMGIPGQVYTKKWGESFELRVLSEAEELELNKCDGLVSSVNGSEIVAEKEAISQAKKQFGRKGEGIDWLLSDGKIGIEFNNQTGEIKYLKGVDLQAALC